MTTQVEKAVVECSRIAVGSDGGSCETCMRAVIDEGYLHRRLANSYNLVGSNGAQVSEWEIVLPDSH